MEMLSFMMTVGNRYIIWSDRKHHPVSVGATVNFIFINSRNIFELTLLKNYFQPYIKSKSKF